MWTQHNNWSTIVTQHKSIISLNHSVAKIAAVARSIVK